MRLLQLSRLKVKAATKTGRRATLMTTVISNGITGTNGRVPRIGILGAVAEGTMVAAAEAKDIAGRRKQAVLMGIGRIKSGGRALPPVHPKIPSGL